MTTDEVKKVVKQKRPAAMAGGIAGVVILVAYLGYTVAVTPSKPSFRDASPQEIITFVASDRGLGGLTQVEQEQFLNQWREVLLADAEKMKAVKHALSELQSGERKALVEAFFKHIKRGYLDDARRYKNLDQDKQYAFLAGKVREYEERAVFMKGVASGIGPSDFGSQDDMKAWLLEHTTEEERQLGMPYMEALAQVAFQLKKQRGSGDASRATTVRADGLPEA